MAFGINDLMPYSPAASGGDASKGVPPGPKQALIGYVTTGVIPLVAGAFVQYASLPCDGFRHFTVRLRGVNADPTNASAAAQAEYRVLANYRGMSDTLIQGMLAAGFVARHDVYALCDEIVVYARATLSNSGGPNINLSFAIGAEP